MIVRKPKPLQFYVAAVGIAADGNAYTTMLTLPTRSRRRASADLAKLRTEHATARLIACRTL